MCVTVASLQISSIIFYVCMHMCNGSIVMVTLHNILCIYACVHTHICVQYIYIYIYIYMHIYTYIQLQLYETSSAQVPVSMYVSMYACMYAHKLQLPEPFFAQAPVSVRGL